MSFHYLLLFIISDNIEFIGSSNSKSVSTYAFGIPTNVLFMVSKWPSARRWEEKKSIECVRAVHGQQRGKGTESGKPEPMPRVVAFDLPEESAVAALHNGADLRGLLLSPIIMIDCSFPGSQPRLTGVSTTPAYRPLITPNTFKHTT